LGAEGISWPIADSAELSIKALKNGTLTASRGYSSGMCTTHVDVINADLLAFIHARLALTSCSRGRALSTGDEDVDRVEAGGAAQHGSRQWRRR